LAVVQAALLITETAVDLVVAVVELRVVQAELLHQDKEMLAVLDIQQVTLLVVVAEQVEQAEQVELPQVELVVLEQIQLHLMVL
jgi:hypothetical protein